MFCVAACASSLDAPSGFYAGIHCALLALQCCRVQLLSTLGVSCSPSPCALARCTARLLNAGVNCASRVAVLPFAVTVCPWRQLFSVCSRSMRCQGLLCWCQLRFSRCSAAVCCRCLSAASAVLRRRVPSLDALPGFYAGFNCAYRVAVLLVCSHCLISASDVLRRRVCVLARCAVRLLCWHQLRFSLCSAAVCSRCLSSASAALRRRVLSLDAPPGFYAGVNCAPRCSGGARALAAAAAAGKQL